MAIQKKNEQLNYDTRSNFGIKGWWVVIFSALNWAFYGGIVNSSMNTVVPQLAGKLGVEAGNLLSLSTPAGLIALVVCLCAGRLVAKLGVKNVNGLALVLAAVAVFAWGTASTVAGYTIALVCVVSLLRVVELVGGNMTITNWFPKKKGIAIGWSTMGLNISSACFVTILVGLTAKFGDIKYALWVMAGCLVILAIINFTAFKNYPEEWGAYPDNDPTAKREDKNALRTGWTQLKVLKQKETWMVGLGSGFYGMVTIGFVSTLIPSMIMKGFTQPQALTMMTISSLLGMVGSYLYGWLDQKIGPQAAAALYGIFVVVGIVFFFLPGTVCAWIYLIFMGLSIGGSDTAPPSMSAQIFGRDGSVVAFPVVYFIKGLLCVIPYLILGQSLTLTGSYNAGWALFAVLTLVAALLFFLVNPSPKKDPIDE